MLNVQCFSAHVSFPELKTSFIPWAELAAGTEGSLLYVYLSSEKSSSCESISHLPRPSIESLTIFHSLFFFNYLNMAIQRGISFFKYGEEGFSELRVESMISGALLAAARRWMLRAGGAAGAAPVWTTPGPGSHPSVQGVLPACHGLFGAPAVVLPVERLLWGKP